MTKLKMEQKNKSFVRKLIPAVLKGTFMFIISIIIFFALLNIGAMVFQHKDAITVLNEFNQERIDQSNSNYGAIGTLLSNDFIYPFLTIVLILDYGFCIYFKYPKENQL